jgi:hypothetical protein
VDFELVLRRPVELHDKSGMRHGSDSIAGWNSNECVLAGLVDMQRKRSVWSLVLGLFVAVLAVSLEAQEPEKNSQPEQTRFGADWVAGEVFISKPVQIPLGALQVIRDNLSLPPVAGCLERNGMTSEQVPASWFAASEIHLAGPEEVDLIVQPDLPKIVSHEIPPETAKAANCLLGANVGRFWVMRKNPSGRYSLLLATVALGLEVLDSRANFYRNIRTGASTAVTSTTILYKMYAGQYQLAEKKTEP